MLRAFKNIIPLLWKVHLKDLIIGKKNNRNIERDKPKIFVALAADYGNLGDVAITTAQITFLQDLFPNYNIITVYINELYEKLFTIRKLVTSNDIITIIGGGNMGNMYEGFEENRRNIVELFPNNKIISFPQTIDFEMNKKGEKSLGKSIKVYSKHDNLHIFAREVKSYEIMKKQFKNNKVYLVPDIVLYLSKEEPKLMREGILLCLRNDGEKKLSSTDKDNLITKINNSYSSVGFYDTHIGDENYKKENANQELEKIWNAFKSSRLVITDRLHGMIFCAITQTPCLVLPNSNHKIAGTYSKWLSKLEYIKFVESYDENLILNLVRELYELNLNTSRISLSHEFFSLKSVLKENK
ncbi:polysaccharide pyruvyl transferase [Mycobacteroides abscessus subsp. abscessus]|nr:polysaccharide pyruvyl transferase [Mycobacteroides abscessus subsp. abscessus]